MKRVFKAENISCKNCANTIKATLEDEFGEIVIDLEKEPKEVSLFIQDEAKVEEFKEEMAELGFKITCELK